MLWFVGAAMAADVHAKLATEDGVTQEVSWPALETFAGRWGPVTHGHVSSVWTLSVQPAVWDSLQGGYLVDLATCVEWTKGHKGDRQCQTAQIVARPDPQTQTWKLDGKGASHAFTLTTWLTGDTPPSGLPEAAPEQPAPEP